MKTEELIQETIKHLQEIGWHSAEDVEKFFEERLRAVAESARAEEFKRIEKDTRACWKHGDLREGNFDNCMNQIFK